MNLIVALLYLLNVLFLIDALTNASLENIWSVNGDNVCNFVGFINNLILDLIGLLYDEIGEIAEKESLIVSTKDSFCFLEVSTNILKLSELSLISNEEISEDLHSFLETESKLLEILTLKDESSSISIYTITIQSIQNTNIVYI